MKKLTFGLVVAVVLALAIVVARNAKAQRTPAGVQTAGLDKFEQLVIPLLKRGESNTVAELSSIVSAMYATRDATDIAVTVKVLQSVRLGRTNDAIRLLETRLDGAMATLSKLPNDQRDVSYDLMLDIAKEYRAKHPRPSGEASKALDSLPK